MVKCSRDFSKTAPCLKLPAHPSCWPNPILLPSNSAARRALATQCRTVNNQLGCQTKQLDECASGSPVQHFGTLLQTMVPKDPAMTRPHLEEEPSAIPKLGDDDLSEASTVLFLHDCAAWTVRIAPVRKPMRWLVVNVFWAIMSVGILIDTAASIHNERARVVAEELYLLYNITSTAIYSLEVSLTVLERRFVREKSLTWVIRLEVCLAIFFLWDSIQGLMAWQVHEEDVMSIVWSTLLNIAAYIYVAAVCWIHSQKRAKRERRRADDKAIESAAYQAMEERGKPERVRTIPDKATNQNNTNNDLVTTV